MGRRKGTPVFGQAKAREGLDYTERQLSIRHMSIQNVV